MQSSVMYWVGLIAGGAAVGALVGIIPLTLGFTLKVQPAGFRSFFVCVLVEVIGGVKTLGIILVPLLLPIFKAHKDRKHRLAQLSIKTDDSAGGGTTS